jgi:cytochrome c peroxidase
VRIAAALTAAAKTLAALAFAALAAGVSGAGAFDAGASPAPQNAPDPARDYSWTLPRGFPVPAVPTDNPMSEAKVALGRKLFHDTRLSVTDRYSCASCHDPARAFTDGRARAVGATGGIMRRGAMTLTNVAYDASYGWITPHVTTLEAQMRQPLFNEHPIEMGLSGRQSAVVAMLRADPHYAEAFRRSFPSDLIAVSLPNMTRAIAAYERTLISGASPFDRYVYQGDHAALDEPAKRGLALFYSKRVGCANCHRGFNFTGTWTEREHPRAPPSFARNGVVPRPMRIPTLRNIALTAPYMHDGRFTTLDEVIRHYERAGGTAAKLAVFRLTDQERRDLIAFLDSLTDREFIEREGR